MVAPTTAFVAARSEAGMSDAGDKVTEAVRLQEAGQTAAAEALLVEAVAEHPESLDARFRLGVLYMHGGRFEEAADTYGRVLKIDPANPAVLANLGAVLQALGRTPEAEARYREAIIANPAVAAPHVNLGSLLQEDGRTDEAIASFKAALRIDSADATALRLLTTVLVGAERLEEAEQALDSWRAIDPDDPDLAFLAGAVHLVRGEPAVAIPHLQRAAQARPETVAATLARALMAAERRSEASGWFETALEQGTGDHELLSQYGANLRELGRLAAASQAFNRVLEADPRFVAARVGLGTVRQAEYRHWEALREFDRALEAAPDNAPALANKATSLQLRGRPEEALGCDWGWD